MSSNKTLVVGGSGLIGKHLSKVLSANDYNPIVLSRRANPSSKFQSYEWRPEAQCIDPKALEGLHSIVNLAGDNISEGRWTKAKKQKIYDSRIKSVELLFDKLKQSKDRPSCIVAASAIGFYGTFTSEDMLTETSPAGTDFLANTCRDWEAANERFTELGIRVVKIRIGVVFSAQGGMIKKILPMAHKGLLSIMGDGKQYMPWVHQEDLCNIILKAIADEDMSGVYNGVSPASTTNLEFTKELSAAVGRQLILPRVPAFLIRLAMGEMSDIMLKGSRVYPEKLLQSGFKFKHDTLKKALTDLLQ